MAENITITSSERKYKTIITDVGNEKIARATLEGEKVDIVTAVVTDGGGQYFVPTGDMTALPNEVWRGPIADKEINAASRNMIDVRIFLDASVGGFTARGIGLLDSGGDLIAVCNMPDTVKAVIVDGAAATLTLIMHIVVTNVDALEFKIDPSVDTVSSAELKAAIQRNTEEIIALVNAMLAGMSSILTVDIVISPTGWEKGNEPDEPEGWHIDVPQEQIREDMVPILTILPAYMDTAEDCSMSSVTRTLDGVLRIYAESAPEAEIRASLALLCTSGGGGGTGSVGAGYVLPPATEDRLGGVKVGNGLNVGPDGTLSVNPNKIMTDEDLADEAEVAESVAKILNGDGAK